MKKKIFLLYPYYYPHYKAGGPVQSIYNIAGYFRNEGEFFFISLNTDIDNSTSEISVVSDSWQKGPQGENIYYTSSISFFLLRRLINQIKPEVIFVNGLFNASTTLSGVILAKLGKIKLVISPRGMLQPWALQQRKAIKRIYVKALKVLLNKKEIWHATDELEKEAILSNFGKGQFVYVASNIPRQILTSPTSVFPASSNKIKLIFLSLINPNKNLHLIIEQVKRLPEEFTLDIYGPVMNVGYWENCLEDINKSSAEIVYKGGVPSWKVPEVMKQYHFFVLPTQGENFGHAIFDALSCGVPVIISKNTPWLNIESSRAGYYMDINNKKSIDSLFDRVSSMNEEEYLSYRKNSIAYAKGYFDKNNFFSEYKFLIQ